ncbi:hypothetical protein P9112_014269 [Eukaryota sp. TZLM1-RC]
MQFALHALVGLFLPMILRLFSLERTLKYKCAVTIWIASVAADADIYLQAIVFPFDSTVASTLHRSFSHSLLSMFVVAFFAVIICRKQKDSLLIIGCAFVAYLTHLIFDIFFWFAKVHLFWPFFSPIDFWNSISYPQYLQYITRSFEHTAVAIYLFILYYLRSKTCKVTPTAVFIGLGHFFYSLFLLWAHFTQSFDLVFLLVFIPLLFVSIPICTYYTFKYKQVLYDHAFQRCPYYAK